MEIFSEYLAQIHDQQHCMRTKEVLNWVKTEFPNLEPKIAWNQPMFTDHGSFIIGFSISKQHLAVSPEQAGIVRFTDDIMKAGYSYGKMLFRIKWGEPVDYLLLSRMIQFNILDKADWKSFWRK